MSEEAMRQGHDLEQYVADRWMEATGKRCQRNNFMWRSTEHPFMIADIDREVIGENAALECKTTTSYRTSDLEQGIIPLPYYVQCMHYMAVMGYERMYLAVLVLGRSFHHFIVERNEGEIAALIEQEEAFWEMVQNHTPPAVDGSDATLKAIGSQYPPGGVTDIPADFTPNALDRLKYLDELDTQIKQLTTARKAAQAEIELEMGECTFGRIGDYDVSWKPQSRTTIDTKRLKAEKPDIWEAYSKTSESRVFKTKRREVSEV